MSDGNPASNTSDESGTSPSGQNEPATSLFWQPRQHQPQPDLFRVKPAGTGLFDQSTTVTFPFGSTTTSGLFGQSNLSMFNASNSNSSFGQISKSLFGGTNGSFNGDTTWFGATAVPNPSRPSVDPFNPLIGQDTLVRNGMKYPVLTKIMCVPEATTKSIHELRVEDYLAGRKRPTPGSISSGFRFGTTADSSLTGSSLFGSSVLHQKRIVGSTTTAAAPFTFGSTRVDNSIFEVLGTAPATRVFQFGKPSDFTFLNSKKVVEKERVSVDDGESKEFLLAKIAELGGKLAIRDFEIAKKKEELKETTRAFKLFRSLKNGEIKYLKEENRKLREERNDGTVKNGKKEDASNGGPTSSTVETDDDWDRTPISSPILSEDEENDEEAIYLEKAQILFEKISSLGEKTAVENAALPHPYRDEDSPSTSSQIDVKREEEPVAKEKEQKKK